MKNSSSHKSTFPSILRVEYPIDSIDAIKWLSNRHSAVKILWSNREKTSLIAGIGVADRRIEYSLEGSMQTIRALEYQLKELPDNCRYYGGVGFPGTDYLNSPWKDFGRSCFILPRIELICETSGCKIASNIPISSGEKKQLLLEKEKKRIRFFKHVIKGEKESWPTLQEEKEIPSYEKWECTVSRLLEEISLGNLGKLVLARKKHYRFDRPLQPLSVLKEMTKLTTESYRFYFQPTNHQAFISVTPECLFRRENRHIFSEAIAGTDLCTAKDTLLHSAKALREHRFVTDHIRNTLRPLCRDLTISKDISLLRIGSIQHLIQKLSGYLLSTVSDADILDSIHPTPAVNGYPSTVAQHFIKMSEPFSRGWYAGAIGWMGKNQSEFAVGIRSAMIQRNSLSLFAGAGIVAGSSPKEEWLETQRKIQSFFPFIR